MSVTVTFDYYSELCRYTNLGRNLLDLPDRIIDALDDYFDGNAFDWNGYAHPDNVWVNSYSSLSDREVLIDLTGLLTRQEFTDLVEEGRLSDFIGEHMYEIKEHLDSVYLLGYEFGDWHVLYCV
ncbi:hypothetical protein [Streptococcus cuniculi]|uniref:Uncharacterized protein n=1 Tax=Streptococcus cuniculi TaxID=1432788 RepID=A0A4Y9JAX5_9STRE|nr:hypothetical protein [Streptococcus cuniculi]MBF0777872.1 hypothetical protein [Streptococcus cuniculi]TFU98170.1 hypothetical protein E4T82_03935 [Streptococcus cuniculi]